jgi:nucleoid-associated protein YgaU
LASFALATRWQDRWTEELRSERDRKLARQELPSDDRAPVLGQVVVGLQSGAPAFDAADRARPAPDESGGSTKQSETSALTNPAEVQSRPTHPIESAPPGQSAQESVGRVFQLTVQRGQQLGDLCRKHYGSGRRELIDAVARYNHMANPDQLREGQQLFLPPLESLIGERR